MNSFISNAPQALQGILQEREKLLEHIRYGRFFRDAREYYRLDDKCSKLDGLVLDGRGCVRHTWGNVGAVFVLKTQRLWCIDQQLESYKELE